jgi:hypothetical protein
MCGKGLSERARTANNDLLGTPIKPCPFKTVSNSPALMLKEGLPIP